MSDPTRPTSDDLQTAAARSDRVSEELKAGFAALGPADIPAEEKGRWQQRLIAITNAAKHDLATAERRLERFWADWESEVGPRPTG